MTYPIHKKTQLRTALFFIMLGFGLMLPKLSLAARVVRAAEGDYTVLLADSDPTDLIKGNRLDVRFAIIPGIFDARVVEKKGDYIRIKMIDGPGEVPPGTFLFLKNLSVKKWFTREDLSSSSSLSSTFWGGAFANSSSSFGGIMGITWLANKTIDLEVSGRIGKHFKGNGNGVFLYGGGAGGKYFLWDRIFIGVGSFYLAAEEDNPKAPKQSTSGISGVPVDANSASTRVMPNFHDEHLIFAESSLGFRLNTISNIKIGKGFTINGELGAQFLVSVVSDNISDIPVIDADLITNSDTNLYGKMSFGYFF